MGFMMVALRQHLPRPFNSAVEVHCGNYFGYPDSDVFWQRNLKRALQLQNRITAW
jgi:predicted acetyltransferase